MAGGDAASWAWAEVKTKNGCRRSRVGPSVDKGQFDIRGGVGVGASIGEFWNADQRIDRVDAASRFGEMDEFTEVEASHAGAMHLAQRL